MIIVLLELERDLRRLSFLQSVAGTLDLFPVGNEEAMVERFTELRLVGQVVEDSSTVIGILKADRFIMSVHVIVKIIVGSAPMTFGRLTPQIQRHLR